MEKEEREREREVVVVMTGGDEKESREMNIGLKNGSSSLCTSKETLRTLVKMVLMHMDVTLNTVIVVLRV